MEEHGVILRQVWGRDCEDLGRFLEENSRPEVTRHFHPFPLSRQTACLIACTEHLDKYYIAIKSERIVGLCMLRGWDEGYEIPSFGILVDHRCKGLALGRQMTEFAIAKARELGCPSIRLSVYSSNAYAIGLYQSLGFKEISNEPVEVNGEQDVKIIMMKELKYEPIH